MILIKSYGQPIRKIPPTLTRFFLHDKNITTKDVNPTTANVNNTVQNVDFKRQEKTHDVGGIFLPDTPVDSYREIKSGLDFILSHFSEPWFPRKVSTAATRYEQKSVACKDRALLFFKDALWKDCRINAFYIGQTNPDLIFIDLDLKDFGDGNTALLKRALTNTLKTIKQKIGGHPTVIWSGNGYHIIQPIKCDIALELIPELYKLEPETSKAFLQFLERYLSNGKACGCNNPSLKSCLIRVPGTVNAKDEHNLKEVKIVQEWDGRRPDFRLLIGAFHVHLAAKKKAEAEEAAARTTTTTTATTSSSSSIAWIESSFLLQQHHQIPLQNHRKYVVALILSRYLVNVKKLPYDQAYTAIWQWLDKCHQLKRLEPSRSYFDRYVVKRQLKEARISQRLPMKLTTLQEKNPELARELTGGGGDGRSSD
jgi:hypothetical protein